MNPFFSFGRVNTHAQKTRTRPGFLSYNAAHMESKPGSAALGWHILKIAALDALIFGVAGLLSLYMSNFGALLLLAGLIVGVVGATRGGPTSIDSLYDDLILRRYRRESPPPRNQRAYIIEHSVSTYAFENVMALAGLIAILTGIFLIVTGR
jgi:hypothetical protein